MELCSAAINLMKARGWELQEAVKKQPPNIFLFLLPDGRRGRLLIEDKDQTPWTSNAVAEMRGVLASLSGDNVIDILVIVSTNMSRVTPEVATTCAQKVKPQVQILCQETVLAHGSLAKRVSKSSVLKFLNKGGMPFGDLDVPVDASSMWHVRADDTAVMRAGASLGDILQYDADATSQATFRCVIPAS